ncbi:hypothetical protein AB685_17030 [Bacillus sp. LL01]|uniref:hypothetical protein n=1 Tax=Bacillus sp. LL01 TaxID=1665556 RepID=UPI00064CE261|nr:hypothetical protein [Bacillus sp. LL01]KMJ57121.1 hypothetical protein AB685_17030 [Bacillus sp. LL01]
MADIGEFSFETALDTIYYGIDELMSAKEELFIDDFQRLFYEMLKLDDEMESFRRKKTVISEDIPLSRQSFALPRKAIPDYSYVRSQIEGVRVDIDVQLWMIDHVGFQEKLDKLDLELEKLCNKVEAAHILVNFNYDDKITPKAFKVLFPDFTPLLDRIFEEVNRQKVYFEANPYKKNLPKPKSGHRKQGIFFETFSTGSKARVDEQGRGRSADLTKLPSRRKRATI